LKEEAVVSDLEMESEGDSDDSHAVEADADDEFAAFKNTGELDLPDDEEVSEESEEEVLDEDSDLEEYYRELGIETEKKEKPKRAKEDEAMYVIKEKKPTKAEEETKKKGDVIDRLINATKADPSYKTVVRCLQIVKNVFGAAKQDQDVDYPDEDKKGR
jgi:hypothetical protein